MNWQFNPVLLIPLLSATLTAVLAWFGWRKRPAAGAFAFSLVMLSVTIWGFGNAMELGAVNLPTKFFWLKIEYIGILILPAAWTIFAVQFTGHSRWLTRRNLQLLAAEPIWIMVLLLTSGFHDLFLEPHVRPGNGIPLQWDNGNGLFFWVNIAYSYFLILFGSFLLLQFLSRARGKMRGGELVVIVGVILPWVANVFSNLYTVPLISGVDLTPFALSLTGLAFAWGLFHLRLLEIRPGLDEFPEELSGWRSRVLDGILSGIFIIWLIALAGGINNVLDAYQDLHHWYENPLLSAASTIFIFVATTALLTFITFKRNIRYELRAGLFLFILYALGTTGLYNTALSGDGRIFYFALVILTVILFDLIASLIVLAAILLTYVAVGWMQVSETIFVPLELQANAADPAAWLSGGIILLALSVAALTSISYLLRALESSLQRSRETLQREQRLSRVLRTLSEVNQLIVREQDQGRLVKRICEIIVEGRGYSFAWIGLLDPDRVTLRLAAFAGEVIDPDRFALRLNEEGIGPICAAEALRQRIPFHAGGVEPDPCNTCPLLHHYPKRISVTFPLLRSTDAYGALTVVHASPQGGFDEEELDLLSELANDLAYALENMGKALENERLYAETRAKARELGALYAAAQDMASSLLDPPALLAKLARHMTEALQVTSGNIMSVNFDDGIMQVVAEYWDDEASPVETQSDLGRIYPVGDYATIMKVIRSGEIIVIHSDDETLLPAEKGQFVEYGVKSMMFVPIMAHGQLFGNIELWESRHWREFTPQDIRLAQAMAGYAAPIIENAQLFAQTREQESELRAMLTVSRAVSSSLQLSDVLRQAASTLARLMRVDFCSLSDYFPERNEIVTIAIYSADDDVSGQGDLGHLFSLDEYPVTLQVLLNGQPFITRLDDPNADPSEVKQLHHDGMFSSLLIPLRLRGQSLGLAELFSADPKRHFKTEEVQFACALADQVAVAIENARLYEKIEQSETHFRALIENAVDSVAILDAQGNFIYVTHKETSLTGYTYEETIGQSAFRFVHPDDLPGLVAAFQEGIRTSGSIITREYRLQRKDGSWGHYEVTGHNLLHDPRVGGVVINYRDISERKRIEQALAEREAYFRAVVENAAEGIAIVDAQGIVRYIAPSEERLTGYLPEEIQGQSAFRYIHPDDLSQLLDIFNEGAAVPGAVRTVHYRLRRKDGEWHHYEVTGHNMLDDPHIAGIVVNYRDITERKQAEETLLRQNQYLVALQTTTLGLIGRLDLLDLLENIVTRAGELAGTSHGAILLVEPGETEMVLRVGIGIEKDYLGVRIRRGEGLSGKVWQTGMPMTVSDYHTWAGRKPDPSHDIFRASAAMPLTSGERAVGVIMLDYLEEGRVFAAGEMDVLRQFAQLASVALENARLYEAAQKELAERKQAEEALRESRSRLEGIINTALNAIITVNEEQQIIIFNPAAEKVFGWQASEIMGQHLNRLIPERYRGIHRDHVGRYSGTGITSRSKGMLDALIGLRANGEEFPMDAFISQNAVSGQKFFTVILQDITERRHAEAEVKRHTLELETLVAVSSALRTASSAAEMIPIIARHAANVVHAANGSIFLLDAESGELVSSGWYEAEVDKDVRLDFESVLRHRLGEGITGRVAQSGQIHFTEDVHTDPAAVILPSEEERLREIHSGLSLPLRAHEQVVGVLHVWLRERRTFTEIEIRLLTAIAEMAGNAIHRASLFEQTLKHAAELALAYDNTLAGWARALELRDELTEGHTRRVTELTLRLARALNVSETDIVQIRRGALLHDIGKMGIPDAILNKPGPFTGQERKIMQEHPQYAHDMLAAIPFLQNALDIPYCHHEHWNGKGYPRGLKGEEIPLAARIFSIVDVWDALTSDRPYRNAWPKTKARKYIIERAGKQFDPHVVEAFFALSPEPD